MSSELVNLAKALPWQNAVLASTSKSMTIEATTTKNEREIALWVVTVAYLFKKTAPTQRGTHSAALSPQSLASLIGSDPGPGDYRESIHTSQFLTPRTQERGREQRELKGQPMRSRLMDD
jgi:hypothetical protein